MALDPSNSSNSEQLALKGLIVCSSGLSWFVYLPAACQSFSVYLTCCLSVCPCCCSASDAWLASITNHLLYVCHANFLLLFVFLISSILHHHPALLHRHTLILDRLLIFLVAFSTLVLKLSFSQSLSLHTSLSLPRADLLEL